VRERIGLVGPDRGLVVLDRLGQLAVLEAQVPQVRHRGCEPRVERERGIPVADRSRAIPETQVRDPALVVDASPLAIVARLAQARVERGERPRRVAAIEKPDRSLEGGPRSNPSGEESAQRERHDAADMLNVEIVTLFPEMFAPFIGLSIVGRAVERGLVAVRLHHVLDFCADGERADAPPYGGGPGMVMRLEPLSRAIDTSLAGTPPSERRALVLTSAAGRRFVQADAVRFAGLDRLVIVCGRYEGVDERLSALYPLEELSLGDFVLTGGEIPALVLLDATARLLSGAIRPESAAADSFAEGDVLDHPAYTRPPSFRGVEVPPVLLSGDHAKIAAWRREQSRARTVRRRDPEG